MQTYRVSPLWFYHAYRVQLRLDSGRGRTLKDSMVDQKRLVLNRSVWCLLPSWNEVLGNSQRAEWSERHVDSKQRELAQLDQLL